MMCARCGRSNPEGARFCAYCSVPLEAAAEATMAPDATRLSDETRPSGGASPAGRLPSNPGTDPFPPGTQLGARYEILRLLGRGGMGAVYLARDRELGREVALKLIAPHLLAEPGFRDRFRREVQLSSIVTHPNVLRVYDLGEADGVKFLTMQFVEGEALDDLLKAGRLPLDRALGLFRQVCEGLAAAHDKGVLHRDLKPQNVMLDAAGQAYLTDFGLATSDSVASMTQTGAVIGTPHYMSPEQVKGESVDARSDIFSLGVVFFEMLTGQRPYTGDSVFDVMLKRVREPAPRALDLDPTLPIHLQQLLDRCLAIDKGQRYESVRDLLADLDAGEVRTPVAAASEAQSARSWQRPVAALAGLALLVAGGWWGASAWLARRAAARSDVTASTPAPAVPLVGVAPFVNRTGQKDLDWAGDGVARLVADGLAASRHLRVVSPQRLAQLRRGTSDEAAFLQAAAASGLGFVLTGEVLPAETGFLVTSRLTDVRSGTEVSADRGPAATASAVLGAANRIAMVVKRGLQVPLTEGVDTYAADFATQHAPAYEAFVAGVAAMSTYRYDEALARFGAALTASPDFTMARLRLANTLAAVGRDEDAQREIATAMGEAARLPDRDARYVRAAERYLNRDYDAAEAQYRDMTDRYPYDLEPRQYLGNIYLARGDWAKAIEQAEVMARIDPQAATTYAIWGSAFLGQKDYNRAITQFSKYQELDAGSANSHHLLGDAYRAQGVLDLAAAEYARALDVDPGFHFSTIALAQVEAVRGRYAEAERRLAPLVGDERAQPGFRVDAALDLASILRAMGRFRDSSRVLERMEAPLAAERIREAQALAVRALNAVEARDPTRAEQLATRAIAKSPTAAPTRYLFALGLVRLAQGRLGEVRATAAKIGTHALPPDDPDRTEDKAAAYLTGLASLADGKATEAIDDLTRAVGLSGYEYARYSLGLGRAYLAAGRHPEALANTTQAAALPDPSQPRLDLELDRQRALLTQAQVSAAMGRGAEAAATAARVLEAWARADPGFRDAVEARRLAAR
jgi:tetratricopeptide (TPR) repeat protein